MSIRIYLVMVTSGETEKHHTHTHTHTHTNIYVYIQELVEKFDDVICAVDSFDKWNPSTSTSMEDMRGLQGELCWKINLINLIS